MGRKRLEEGERRIAITIRLQKKLLDRIKEIGDVRKTIEKIIESYFK